LTKIENLHLIQPVDIWVERAAEALGCEEKSKVQIAKYISSYEQRVGIQPGGSNIAFGCLAATIFATLTILAMSFLPSATTLSRQRCMQSQLQIILSHIMESLEKY